MTAREALDTGNDAEPGERLRGRPSVVHSANLRGLLDSQVNP